MQFMSRRARIAGLLATTLFVIPSVADADGTQLGTGQSMTPTAAPGSTIIDLNPRLTPVAGVNMLPDQDVTKFLAGQPETTALSPDGRIQPA
jgi:hypothetical protein